MTETNASRVFDGDNSIDENKTSDENLTAPVAAEVADTGGEQPGHTETPIMETPEAPQVADGDVVVPTNVIDGVFDEKRAAVREAEKQAAEMDKTEQEAPADEKLLKEQAALLKSLDEKSDDFSKKNPAQKKKNAPAKADKPEKSEKPPKAPKEKETASAGGGGVGGTSGQSPDKDKAPSVPAIPEVPEALKDATRPGKKETIVYIDHTELHPFKDHPFQVRNDNDMKSLVDSIKERGFDQAALVRPREEGGYELVAGHRRQQAAILAGLKNLPCVIREMTDEQAILAMTESNFTYRTEILASERAAALKMQLDAIKRQGERFSGVADGDIGKRSNEIIAEKNKMGAKTVQRYIALNNLTPDMMKLVDDKKIPFMAAYETSFIRPKNQDYIALTVETQGSAPTHPQAQRMRELDAKNLLKHDTIDGIMLEEKKEVRQVIISSQELDKYFGVEKSPKEMKDTILKLLDEYKAKQPPELGKPDKKKDQPEK
jgi:hypothetical protein